MEQQGLWERAERLRGAADEAARLAQNIYLSFLLLGTYIAVIIGSTTDVQLLKVSPVTLPLLNVPLPIVGFYVVVPWFLLLIYFNLLLHLTFLAQRLQQLDAVLDTFPDDIKGHIAREEQRVRMFPFPFSAVLIGRPAQWRLRMLLGLIVLTTVVLLPLVLLLWAQLRFLPYHDTVITWSHRFAVLVDLLLLWLFWPWMLPPVQRSARRFLWGMGLLCLTLVTVVFSLGIAVLPEEAMERWMASHLPEGWVHADPRPGRSVFKLTFWLFETPEALFHRNLRLQGLVLVAGEPSAEAVTAFFSQDEAKRAQGLDKIQGLILTNRNLRGANLRYTFFAKADLRGADLEGADLVEARVFAGQLSPFWPIEGHPCVNATSSSPPNNKYCQTNLQGADLRNAQLQGANLGAAQLQDADLRRAQLQGANLQGAELQGADLREAQLQGADLREAQLQGPDLRRAQLQGADLGAVQLQGADLRRVQLQGADLRRVQLQGADLREAQLQGADLWAAQLQGADLREAQLQGADLREAQLQGADLWAAQLQGANLRRAQLQGADLRRAQLQGADLWHASLGGADFTGADLTLSNLQSLSHRTLDEQVLGGETYEELKQRLIRALGNSDRRAAVLRRLNAAVGQRRPHYLKPTRAEQILCSEVNLLPSCLTDEQIIDYAQARAVFLGTLGCHDHAIAQGLLRQQLRATTPDLLWWVLMKYFAALDKECPGGAILSRAAKDALRRQEEELALGASQQIPP